MRLVKEVLQAEALPNKSWKDATSLELEEVLQEAAHKQILSLKLAFLKKMVTYSKKKESRICLTVSFDS